MGAHVAESSPVVRRWANALRVALAVLSVVLVALLAMLWSHAVRAEGARAVDGGVGAGGVAPAVTVTVTAPNPLLTLQPGHEITFTPAPNSAP